ncbi:eukaryotic translation initiation factor 2A isoform X2 [Amborella trichopoda]|uniref:eukaryotic translation initiation factor 2A isoform X2 n=1 Tax=Amborella trichopoda TaxID=13333 RepID=UPI0009BE7BAE|nr:eukaryotic translation initiation factor 2A isoform X2 [Amborella trichopoda]|eukprot:XP_020530306.1 eukaryotic translation initiation factor 2A isoform X2 [Amborella trichopoda]
MDPSPPLNILVREPQGFSLWTGPPFSNGEPRVNLQVPCSSSKFSEDGSRLLAIKDNSSVVSIYESQNGREIASFQVPGLLAASLSPRGTYLQTFQKALPSQEKNLILWEIDNSTTVYQQFQKTMAKNNWPSIQFSSDEATACRMATNEIQFFDAKDFTKGVLYKLRIPGIASVELSKTPGSHVAAFVSESKGIPASVQIFVCGKDNPLQPVARRSFFRCSTVQLHWNFGSTGLLIVAQSDVDKSNQSYYGESKLNYLTTDGSHEGLVPLRKDGPVHDVQWSPSGAQFVVVYGFLCLAGFGNLPGDMAFWVCSEKRLLGTTKSECSVTSEWSPDGRYFMTATTAPRLQIDNGIKIFHLDGSLYFKKMFEKLYQADWKPEAVERFGDIDELVKFVKTNLKIDDISKGPKPLSQSNTKVSTPAPKPTAYRPPHAKNAAAVQAELFGGGGGPSEEMSKNALRNKKRREKQREKKAAADNGN